MAGVIRRNIPIQTSVLSLDNLERQAANILERAEKTASERCRQLQTQAEAEIQSERERGFQEGLDAGRKAGIEETRAAASAAVELARKEAHADIARLVQALEAALVDISNRRHRLYAEAERGLIHLSLAIARRVCGEIARTSSQPAIEATQRLLDLVRHAHDVELQVNPTEKELLNALTAAFIAKSDSLEHVKLVGNESIARGGAALIAADGTIDATIETQLDRIAEVLLDQPPQASATAPADVADGG